MAQHRPGDLKSKPLISQKLHRTLQDLESAISDWDQLGAAPLAGEPEPSVATDRGQGPKLDDEVRERTKRLLAELKKQLSDLSD